MVVEETFVFALHDLCLAVHLGHLLQAVKDGLDVTFVVPVDRFPNAQMVSTFELTLESLNKQLRHPGQYIQRCLSEPERLQERRERTERRLCAF